MLLKRKSVGYPEYEPPIEPRTSTYYIRYTAMALKLIACILVQLSPG